MLLKLRQSLGGINYRLFGALLFLGFMPTAYTTVRVILLGQLPGEWSFSIAGQLSWVNLIYEVLSEAILLPLFSFVGRVSDDREEFANRVRGGMLVSFALYSLLSAGVFIFAEPLLGFMAADAEILEASASYIRIECVANVFYALVQYALVALVSLGKDIYLYIFAFVRLVMSLLCDVFLVSSLSVSAQLGVNGIGYSNISVNIILSVLSLSLLSTEGINVLSLNKPDFFWMKEFFRVGSISGVESFVRNVAYMLMISRMVNVVGEQGTYWVANNFIWGWLLLPVLQLGELIKKEISADGENLRRNTLGYFGITAVISLLWVVSIPVWKPFMSGVLGFSDVDKLFELVLLLTGFYVLFAFQNVFDATFYALGRTEYMLFESVVTNTVYYGIAYVLYAGGVWIPTLTGIALLFGLGNAFDCIVSFAAYVHLLKKRRISLWKN